uniref:Proline dehydrogenase n=1 Tax=Elaeis guineensis var. tenera TaxID=51953 RepID=A0A6I9QG71_ELAGV|nr:proline dehydrogenase 1, mitochondrial isoform X1 [Elaeis guineensis]
MAAVTRIPPRISQHLLRSLSSLTSPPLNLTEKLPEPADGPPARILDLTDTERLFAAVPTGSLLRSLATLYAFAFDPVVDLGTAVMRSRAVHATRLGGAALLAAVRGTVFRHFCAGEGLEEAGRTLRVLWEEVGLKGILDYGLEDASDGAACDRNLDGFLQTVEMASSLPPTSVSICAKITALCPISLLERVSDLLRWEQNDPSFHLPWKACSFPIFSKSSPLYLTPSIPDPLTEEEERELQLAHQRLSKLCERCSEANLPLLIDAEYASVQPAIDYFTYRAAIQFNRGEQTVVYGTIQAYLRDSKERLVEVVQAAEREGISIGVKLVRGAYLTRETQLASSLGVPSPIHENIQATHRCYNDCALFMLERVRRGAGAVVLATHNIESGKTAAAMAEELGIRKGNQNLHFAQLLGMADGLSLGLRNAGFQVSKYLPFGPVNQIIPYLLRRAEENKGFLSSSALDRQLLRMELTRRCKTALVGRV